MPTKDPSVLVLATRRSPLARRQAELVRAALATIMPSPWKSIELLELVTTGDQQRDWSLAAHGGKGLFTRELEEALLHGRADVAVHSAKDLPTTLPDGLVLAGFLSRASARDVLVRRADVKIPRRVATGSPRRRAQAAGWWPDVAWTELRGNVETRLKKIAAGEADATFLAAAGLERLGITQHDGLAFELLDFERMIPAAGQGAIALETRFADTPRFNSATCARTLRAVTVERTVLAALGGGCQTSSAVHLAGDALYVFYEPRGRVNFTVTAREATAAAAEAVSSVKKWLTTKTGKNE